MRIRKIAALAIVAIALAIPGVSLAKHGIGKGGVPALRDSLLELISDLNTRIGAVEDRADDAEARLDALEALFTDVDGDGFYVLAAPDCNDADANVSPDAVEVPGNLVDENCDGVVAP